MMKKMAATTITPMRMYIMSVMRESLLQARSVASRIAQRGVLRKT
jgi:hypothetical protein